MKTLIFLLIFSATCRAQTFRVKPVIKEPADTIIYHSHGETFAIYLLKDGSAWVQDKSGVVYYSKSYFRRWKKEHVKL